MKKTCKIAGSDEGMEKLYEHTLKRQLESQRKTMEEQHRHIMEQNARMAELTAMMMHLQMQQQALMPVAGPAAQKSAPGPAAWPSQPPSSQPQIVIGHQQQQAQTINNGVMQQITINVFGQEDTKHIGRQTIKDLLDNVLSGTQDPAQGAIAALLKTAMLIYSDADHPENLTCYLPNNKKDDVLVHGAAGWEVQPYTVVLPPMATRSVDTLFDNQPFVDADKYGDLMKALAENEQAYKEGKEMRTILVRNKDLLKQVLGALPK